MTMIMGKWSLGDVMPSPKRRRAAIWMSSLDLRRHKSVVMGPTTTNVARGARPGRRMWPRSHSGPNPAPGKLPMIMEIPSMGGQILRDHEMGAGRLIRVFAGRSYPAAVTTNRGVPGDSPVGCAFGVRTPCGPVPGPRGSGARPLGLAPRAGQRRRRLKADEHASPARIAPIPRCGVGAGAERSLRGLPRPATGTSRRP